MDINGGTPKIIQFIDGIFPNKNHPASLGYLHDYGNLHLSGKLSYFTNLNLSAIKGDDFPKKKPWFFQGSVLVKPHFFKMKPSQLDISQTFLGSRLR